MTSAEQKRLIPLLDELNGGVEELLLSGLTAASKSTVERIDVAFREASRMRLLRLGSTLRIANEEISRFTSGSSQFSARRLAFFLGRAALLATAMRRAIDAGDTAGVDRLMATPATHPVERVVAVVLGVAKRVVPNAFASFDFRMRVIDGSAQVQRGEAVLWSCVFPMRKDLEMPVEAFLHLPQKQKFKPAILVEKKTIEFTRCGVSRQNGSAARLTLSDASTVKTLDAFDDWPSFWKWDIHEVAGRLKHYQPTPLDLEIEFQEEAFLDDWKAGERTATEESYDVLSVETALLPFEVRLDRGPSGSPLSQTLEKLAKAKKRPPLYGVVHYESCRLVMQPLAVLGNAGPEYVTLAADKISQAQLVKAMKFT